MWNKIYVSYVLLFDHMEMTNVYKIVWPENLNAWDNLGVLLQNFYQLKGVDKGK
jgi:hypothetical protein